MSDAGGAVRETPASEAVIVSEARVVTEVSHVVVTVAKNGIATKRGVMKTRTSDRTEIDLTSPRPSVTPRHG